MSSTELHVDPVDCLRYNVCPSLRTITSCLLSY